MLPARELKQLGASAPAGGCAGGRAAVLSSLFPAMTKAVRDFLTAAGHVGAIDVEVRAVGTARSWHCAVCRVSTMTTRVSWPCPGALWCLSGHALC